MADIEFWVQVMLVFSGGIIGAFVYHYIPGKANIHRLEKFYKEELIKAQIRGEVEAMSKLAKSRAVTRGLITEQFVPLLDGFPYTLSDCYFLGKPFDYIIYDGMSAYRDGDKEASIEVIFADVKFNTSGRTPVQTAIKNAIDEGRVKYIDLKVDKSNKLIINDKSQKNTTADGTQSYS